MRTPERHGRRPAARRAQWATAWLLAGTAAAEAQPFTIPPLPPAGNLPAVAPIPPAPPTPVGDLSSRTTQPAEKLKDDSPKPADAAPPDEPGRDQKAKDDKDEKDKEAKEKDAKDKADAGRVTPQSGPPLTLGECLAVAVDRQPNLKAARHSLAATRLGLESLNTVGRLAERLSPDIPVRRQQAGRGIAVAKAALEQVHNETVYDVTRMYWSYIYARQQEVTASDVIDQLEVFHKVLEDIIKSGVPGKLNNFTLYGLRDSISEVKQLRVDAVTGQKAALAALREAMGVEPTYEFHPKDTELPVMEGAVTREQVIAAAVARRPELAQAAAGVDAFRLEVCAQELQLRFRKTVPTLASGSDLHSRQVPMPVRNGEYRPGALAPEMPTMLVGSKESRMARATELAQRQDAVYEKTLALVRLEAENAFTTWEGTTARMREAKSRYDNARQMVQQAREILAVKQDPELVVRSEALAGKAQAEYLKAVFEHIKALATLERVTAGAVRPGFAGR